MIITLTVIAIALFWLLKETDYLRIRLETTEYQAMKIKPEIVTHDNTPEVHYKPSQFTPLDMPDFTGKLNIICVSE